MVKAAKTAKRMGRPPKDAGDLRTERIAMRAHPDLIRHLNDLSRREGLVRSVYIERILVAYVNYVSGDEILDSIGREAPVHELKPAGAQKGLGDNRRQRRDTFPSTVNTHPARTLKR
jgi:hypothetical protein